MFIIQRYTENSRLPKSRLFLLLSDSTSFAYLGSTALSEQQIALKLTIYYKPLNPQHDWCLPPAPYVRSISTICAERQHHMCGTSAPYVRNVNTSLKNRKKKATLPLLYIEDTHDESRWKMITNLYKPVL